MLLKQVLVEYWKGGRILLLQIILQRFEKKILNCVAFSLQLVKNSLSISNGGINDDLHLFKILDTIFQYTFCGVLESFSLSPSVFR